MSNIQKQIAKIILHTADFDQVTNSGKKHSGRHSRAHTIIHPDLERWGAVVFTAICMLVSFEAIVEHGHGKNAHHGSSDPQHVNQIFSRAEPKGETARLPEEFDIGLQTPHVSGL